MPTDKERQIKRQNAYNAKNYDKLTVAFPKGDKERYKLYAESKGKSLTGLIVELIENDIKENPAE